MKIYPNEIKWYGRHLDNNNIRYFDYSASAFEFCFTGKQASCTILSDPENWNETTYGVISVFVKEISSAEEYKSNCFWDNFPENEGKRITLLEKENQCLLFSSPVEKTVVIQVLKISECAFAFAGLQEIEIDGKLHAPVKDINSKNPLKIEIIGDSITCGYGIDGIFEKDSFTTQQERPDKAYGFLTAKKLNADFNFISWSGIGLISNYVDESVNIPDTHFLMPSNWPYTDKSLCLRLGLDCQVWDEKNFSPDIVIVHLGTNDASFVRNVEERRLAYVSALRQFLEAIHRRSPQAKICTCLGVMGQLLCDSVEEALSLFKKDFPSVKTKNVKFPQQLDEDGIGADWHPSAKTHLKISEILYKEISNWK